MSLDAKTSTLADANPIHSAVCDTLRSWAQLEQLIEKSLRTATQDLQEKGIKTSQVPASQKTLHKKLFVLKLEPANIYQNSMFLLLKLLTENLFK